MKRSWLLVSVLMGACSGPAAESGSGAENTTADIQPVANDSMGIGGCRQFTETGLKLEARSRAGLQAEAGRPINTTVRVEPNRHVADVQDSIIRLEYDGMTVQLRVPGPGGELFEQVAVTDRKWLNFPYFRPGVSAEKVIQAIGEPQRRADNRLIYNCGASEADEPVVFEISEGTVQRIVFNYYVD